MDPQRDTPLKRFGAFWIGLFIILSFGIAAIALSPSYKKEVTDPVLQAEYDVRLAIKAEVDAAQAAQFEFKQSGNKAQVAPENAYKYTGKQLLSEKASASTKVVPGSPTDIKANSAQ